MPVKSPEKNNMKKVKIVVGIRRVYRYIDQEKLESECSKIKNKDYID